MKETKFIEQNKHKWNEFERELKSDGNDPEKLSKVFIETTDDLSFSRTYYPNRSVRVYLNDIGQQIYQRIYKTKTDKKNSFGAFWRINLPQALWDNRKSLYWAAGIFFGGMIIAILSSVYHDNFAQILLGDAYINQTIENIENGDPMAIYGTTDPVQMFIEIAWNNIQVCLLVFVLGILAGVGTIYILLYNSIMVGAFLYFFYERELFHDAFYAVMLHGTLELSMIILSGMAGLVLAKGLVFPKSYSRLQSLISSARQAVMIFIGVAVFLVIAAFIEGFATRHTDVSNLVRGTIIFGSFAIVVSYFVLYPYLLHRNGKLKKKDKDELQQEKFNFIDFTGIKSAGIIFTEVFIYMKKFFNQHLRISVLMGVVGSLSMLFIIGKSNLQNFISDPVRSYENVMLVILDVVYPWNEINNLFEFYDQSLLFASFVVFFSLLLLATGHYFRKLRDDTVIFKDNVGKMIFSAVITATLSLLPFVINLQDAFSSFLVDFTFLILLLPILLFTYMTSVIDGISWGSAISRSSMLLKGNYGKLISTSIFVFAMPWILCISCASEIWILILDILKLNISSESELMIFLPALFQSAFMIFILSISVPLYICGMGLLYFSLNEVNTAEDLLSRIKNIHFKKKAYGIEQE